MMDTARNRLLATTDHIKTLRIVIVFLVIFVIAQWFRVGYLQETRRIFVPPDLTQGKLTTFEEVPSAVVYTFAYYIFQQLYRWKTDGEQDYPQKIYTLQGFLTPGCIETLQADMNEKQRLGELRSRVRTVQEVLGQGYTWQRVVIESPDSWLTWLDLNIQEWISGHPVKNVNVRYQFRVVRFDVDKEVNPWGLAIACNAEMPPVLLKDEDIDQPFGSTQQPTQEGVRQ